MHTFSYIDFYEFKREPFSAAPDEGFWFNSPQHKEALLKIIYGIKNHRGLITVTGDIGLGKTTLARKLLSELMKYENFDPSLIVIVHSEIGKIWFLKKIASNLKILTDDNDPVSIISKVSKRLIEMYKNSKIPVILIDEANMLKDKEIMEEIRGLLNIEIPGKRLLSFVLFGLPELEENLKIDMPLYERIALKIKLKPLNFESTKEYILHRLKVAGSVKSVFSDDAYEIIYKYSKGKPRLINTICDNALLEGFLRKRKFINSEILNKVINELGI
ncbi:MAG: AAA family ATPase [Candidatus Hydrothermales bacterium]